MADRLDVLLGILLDKAAQKDVERGIAAIEKAVGKLDEAQLNRLSLELDAAGKTTQELEERFAQARQEAERLNTVSEKLTRNSTMLFVAGTAVVAGAALAAQNYVKFVEDAGIQGDETADRWVAASKRVKNAQLNLGQDTARALLPVYEQLASLAEKVAGFANAHPELVSAAINTGTVVAVVGAIGLAVSKGIRLVADFKYLAATSEYTLATIRFERSVREFLAGEFLPGAGLGNAPVAAGAGALGKAGRAIGTVALYATSVILGAELGNALGNAIAKLVDPESKDMSLNETLFFGGVRAVEALNQRFARFLNDAGVLSDELFNKYNGYLQKTDQWAASVLGISEKQAEQAQELENSLRDFQREADLAQATQAFVQYRQQESQAEQQYMEQRAQIVQQGAAQLAQIEANYSQQRAQLAQQFAASSAQALSNFNYQQAQALEQFNRSEMRALEEYNQSRREARESYQEEEQRSREDHLREMQRMEEESLDRQRELTAARDALGLVKEQRDLARRQRDAEEDYSVERKRRRQDLQQRLQDMDEGFRQERQRRQEDFAHQQAQAQEQFDRQQEQARQQYEARLRQLDEQHRQEMLKARQQTADRLREIDLQHREEQIRRRNAFLDILRDLDANLLGEQNIRKQYYARMQQDLLDFLSATASGADRGSNLPGYQSGGYTPDGAIRAHRGEWVANRETTGALERMLGGRLTQEGVRALGGRGHTQISINARFDRMPAPWEQEQLKRVIVETVEGLVA